MRELLNNLLPLAIYKVSSRVYERDRRERKRERESKNMLIREFGPVKGCNFRLPAEGLLSNKGHSGLALNIHKASRADIIRHCSSLARARTTDINYR